ncbi:hypothetical protein [Oceanidesulfovibrio marinus]|uniref:Uncharacterized protein n=1 Tax=Oceanidesulfovibrio marinus TaxID=370038 RepID=A0A6P1ZCV3_9BACT|nr:hypothetical protein [Oceanidesulfovibrio marinus]TVM31182.1 hypothetical protein DQK91_18910 [Oceanidesulfovibrio marinus]
MAKIEINVADDADLSIFVRESGTDNEQIDGMTLTMSFHGSRQRDNIVVHVPGRLAWSMAHSMAQAAADAICVDKSLNDERESQQEDDE